MIAPMIYKRSLLAAVAGLSLLGGLAVCQPASAQPAPAPARIRGTIDKIDGNMLSVKPRSGADVMIKLTDDLKVVGVKKAQVSDIQPGSFIGSATVPQPDGSEKALEVTVFPPSMKGAGEGSYGWDLGANSTMTNGTVGDLVVSNGRTMTVKYDGQGKGEKKIVVPDDVPIVLLNPEAGRSLLTVGAHIIVVPTKAADGTLTANRISVGENGTVPPM